ncbi:unnamed protein product [Phytophthora fragariaefolia]|uniref:Unnamed protein product n=1 Tax=Phytophthora fragariaefolia TaxID=1490495 RepID=A0A9W6TLP7_9STRA|nr:unnamed protein product [Phytophthora fragariaefolia]
MPVAVVVMIVVLGSANVITPRTPSNASVLVVRVVVVVANGDSRLGAVSVHVSVPWVSRVVIIMFVESAAPAITSAARPVPSSAVGVLTTISRWYGSRRPTAARTAAGARDKASATTFVAPGQYSTAKSYSCSTRDQCL